MSRRHHRKRKHLRASPGSAPGVLVHDPHARPMQISVLAYGPDGIVEQLINSPAELKPFLGRFPVTWINVDGLANIAALQQLGEMFHLHPLALEDVVNRHQRSKVELYGDQIFVITHMVTINDHLESEQLNLFLSKGVVLTLQDDLPGDCLEPVRDRIRKSIGRIRHVGPDYLTYAILDAVTDHYFPVLETIGERLEDLEHAIISAPNAKIMSAVLAIKRQLIILRRTLWPQRDAINLLVRDPLPWITDETRVYFRDCYDHVVRIIELLESHRELGSELVGLQLTSVSNRMNEVMRVLTVMSAIFIPLTFIAGIYGMNFEPAVSPWNMPELTWFWGYPFSLALMACVAGVMVAYFYRKGWLRDSTKQMLLEPPCDTNGSSATPGTSMTNTPSRPVVTSPARPDKLHASHGSSEHNTVKSDLSP